MITNAEVQKVTGAWLHEKLRAYLALLKGRLTLLVAISAAFGYTLASGETFSWLLMGAIAVGGFLVTGASNILNQVFEKEYDGLMHRTHDRPLPKGKVGTIEAVVYALILCTAGMFLLGYFFNLPTALLALIGLLSYAFVYTPLKRHTPFAVFVGAIPGALPPLIGWVAVTGGLDKGGLILFAFQFFWQFPHFWSIAWLLDEDYRKAGFFLLPSQSGKSPASSWLMLVYALLMLPLVMLPHQAGMLNLYGILGLCIAGIGYVWPAYRLHRTQAAKHAKHLMFSSFLYLPIMQLIFLLCR